MKGTFFGEKKKVFEVINNSATYETTLASVLLFGEK